MGCMFDNLIRRDPRDSGKTVIPDLAHSWEIAKDAKTYTFSCARGAVPRWCGTDGRRREGDVRPDRQPAAGHQHPAQHPVPAVSEINARDKYTIEFKLSEPGRDVHHGGDCQRLERDRAQEDAGGQQLQPAQGMVYPGNRSVQRYDGSRKRSGSWRRTRTTGTRGCHISTASSSTTLCRSLPKWLGHPGGPGRLWRVTDPVTFKKAQATPRG